MSDKYFADTDILLNTENWRLAMVTFALKSR
jgi:hypothetical protein